MMRLTRPLAIVATVLLTSTDGFSMISSRMGAGSLSPTPQSLAQKEVTRMTTRRDTIQMPTQTPMVPWTPPGSEIPRFVDLHSAMSRDRILTIGRFIDDNYANDIISTLLYMRHDDPEGDIDIYFNVPGAQLRPALAIYDLMQQTKEVFGAEIRTINLGLCTGMGAFLCAAGTKGRRSAWPNARFLMQRTGLVDQPIHGQAADIVLEVQNIKAWNDRMEGELSRLTGQSLERIQKDLSRDFYLSSEEAVQYGLIDDVLLPAPLKRATRGQPADLGTFEGDDLNKYQHAKNRGGGWGSRPRGQPQRGTGDDGDYYGDNYDDDDDGPEVVKD